MVEITGWSAGETAARVRAREVSVGEVVAAHLARAEAWEPGLGAVVEVLADRAREEAARMDAEGPGEGALWGVPVTVKINTDLKGQANSNGVPAFRGIIAPEDAAVVANLRRAGAVVIGMTNTPEFSLRWFTSNPLHGQTLNPWDAGITPGGSSGGASAAVAAGIGCLGQGNDLGGSLRYPAYCVGGATLRPSLGRVPSVNPSLATPRPALIAEMSVQGVIGRSVADIALALPVLSVGDARDPLWRPWGPGRVPKRVGVCVDPFGDGVAPRVAEAVRVAAEAAREAGFEVVEMVPPDPVGACATWGLILNAEVEAMSRAVMETHGTPEMRQVMTTTAEVFGMPDRDGLVRALAQRLAHRRAWSEMFTGIDALVLPVSAAEPFGAEADYRDPAGYPGIIKAQRALFLVNYLGLPSAVVRTLDARPVPLGVQVVGPMGEDDTALAVAGAIERELGLDLGPLPLP